MAATPSISVPKIAQKKSRTTIARKLRNFEAILKFFSKMPIS
jgi:hypothetical protein